MFRIRVPFLSCIIVSLFAASAQCWEIDDLQGTWRYTLTQKDGGPAGIELQCSLDVWKDGSGIGGCYTVASVIRRISNVRIEGDRLVFQVSNDGGQPSPAVGEVGRDKQLTLEVDESGIGIVDRSKYKYKWEPFAKGAILEDKDLKGVYAGKIVHAQQFFPQPDVPPTLDCAVRLSIEKDEVGGAIKFDGQEYQLTEIRRTQNRIFGEWKGSKNLPGRFVATVSPGGLEGDIKDGPKAWGTFTLKKSIK